MRSIFSPTLVPEVFPDFSSRKRSRASRETTTTSRERDEEREKNFWLAWPRISLSCGDSCQTRQIANTVEPRLILSKPNVTIIELFYYFEDPVNATTSVLRPGFYGPMVVALKRVNNGNLANTCLSAAIFLCGGRPGEIMLGTNHLHLGGKE